MSGASRLGPDLTSDPGLAAVAPVIRAVRERGPLVWQVLAGFSSH